MSSGTTQVSSWTPLCHIGMPVGVVAPGTDSSASVPM